MQEGGSDTTATHPKILDVAQAFIAQKMTESRELRRKVETARTTYKKDYYKKKLRVNNQELMKALLAVEKIKRGETINGDEGEN